MEVKSDVSNLIGLQEAEVIASRETFGGNTHSKIKSELWSNLLSVVKEPMFLLLLAACGIYLAIQQWTEALTMLAALFFVAGIDVFQNFRSQKAIKALSKITQGKALVVRNSQRQHIAPEDIVLRDVLLCEEGTTIPADARILQSSDFAINEAMLSGESAAVEKAAGDIIYQGTLVVRGYCYAETISIGDQTVLAGIGKLVESTGKEKTPLQLKIHDFVKKMVVLGSVAFLFVWLYHWYESKDILHGLLHGLTMAMSVLPEEIPVAFSTFMALGAYRLLKHGVIARSPKTVETLGAATVICLDKTGTITQNLMQVSMVYDHLSGREIAYESQAELSETLVYAMWSSETTPFDPMEKSIHQLYEQVCKKDERPHFQMIHEYPLEGQPPTMTHIFENQSGERIIACKGALEGVLNLCKTDTDFRSAIIAKANSYAQMGLRVLGVAKGSWDQANFPSAQSDLNFKFLGIITFNDPPEPHIPNVLQDFYNAGVKVKMITGDAPPTALAIATKVGIHSDIAMTGNEIAALQDKQLSMAVASCNVFARVSPEVKLKIVEALKARGEIVAMTGDGVNDAPALKAAHIGISMGKRGTDVAKAAAGLVLSNDQIGNMTEAIYLGRAIQVNLSKAIRYIISIHIPIILIVMLPIFFEWLPAMLFAPLHVIFLELIMGPTCSIIYENEPVPRSEIQKPESGLQKKLFTSGQLTFSLFQGLSITAGCMLAAILAIYMQMEEDQIRAMVFFTLVSSNIFLTLINRSFTSSIFQTITRKNRLIPLIIGITILLMLLISCISALRELFDFGFLKAEELLACVGISLLSTAWMEGIKVYRNKK